MCNIEVLIRKFHNNYSNPVIVVMANCKDYPQSTTKIIQAFNSVYNIEDVTFHSLNCGNNFLDMLIPIIISDTNFTRYSLTIEELISGLKVNFEDTKDDNIYLRRLPHSSTTDGIISEDRYLQMKDFIEIVYQNIENEALQENIESIPNSFYRGEKQISWKLLKQNYDVRHSNESNILNNIRNLVSVGKRSIRKVLYEAGVGGSTFLRRTAYELHNEIPTLIIHRYNETFVAEYVYELYKVFKKTILILIDSNDLARDSVESLYAELRISSFAFDIIYFVRKGNENRVNSLGTLTRMDRPRCLRMKELLEPYIEDENNIEKLTKCIDKGNFDEEHIPFIFSLYAFDNKFKGVKDYIEHSMLEIDQIGKEIVFILALADWINYKVDRGYFDTAYSTSVIRKIRNSDNMTSLIKSTIDSTGKRELFQIKYFAYSEEILKNLAKSEEITFSGLLEWILNFIIKSRPNKYVPISNSTLELLNALFITRNKDNEVKPTYSPLIKKLVDENKFNKGSYDSSNDIIIKIYKTLVDTYPDQPHFAGHLARYYFYTVRTYPQGFKYIDQALAVSPQNEGNSLSSLLHIKAMGHSARIANEYEVNLNKLFKNINISIERKISEIGEILNYIDSDSQDAFRLFEESKIEKNSRIVANIAECNLRIKLLGIYNNVATFCAENSCENILKQQWYYEHIDVVEALLEDSSQITLEQDDTTQEDNISKLKKIERDLEIAKGNEEELEGLCKQFIENSNSKESAKYKRMLSRIYTRKIIEDYSSEHSQNNIRKIIKMMEENMEINVGNNANFRIWFNVIRYLNVDNTEELMEDILIKLDNWTMQRNASVEAFYYRYIVKFILAYEQGALSIDSKAREKLEQMLVDLKNATIRIPKKTINFEWFGKRGQGLQRLIKTKDLLAMESKVAVDSLEILTGRLPRAEDFSNRSAQLFYKGNSVYFKPESISDRITSRDANSFVEFGLGFSYDGLRSYHDSIQPARGKVSEMDGKIELYRGKVVSMQVVSNEGKFIKGVILNSCGTEIHVHCNNLEELGYSNEHRPEVHQVIKVELSEEKLVRGKMIWNGIGGNNDIDKYKDSPFAILQKNFNLLE